VQCADAPDGATFFGSEPMLSLGIAATFNGGAAFF
jgi:hypothetical protein